MRKSLPVPEGHRTTRRCLLFGHRLRSERLRIVCRRRGCDGPDHTLEHVADRMARPGVWLQVYECSAPFCEAQDEWRPLRPTEPYRPRSTR